MTTTERHTSEPHTTARTGRNARARAGAPPAGSGAATARSRLRAVLGVNAATSLAGGLLAAAAPGRLDDVLGTGHPGWVRAVGIGLALFALDVAVLARSRTSRLARWTPAVVAADVAWVVATAVTVALGWYDAAGVALMGAVAVAVAGFAWGQHRFGAELRAAPGPDAGA